VIAGGMPWSRSGARCALVLALLLPISAGAVSSFAEVQRDFLPSEASLLDRNGELLQRLRVNMDERKLAWVKLEDVSPALRQALIASEDRRFYQHSGIDWNAVAASAWGNLWNTRTRGASTITMQLAGLLHDDLRRKSGARTLTRLQSGVTRTSSNPRIRPSKSKLLTVPLNLSRGKYVPMMRWCSSFTSSSGMIEVWYNTAPSVPAR
jgi:penicillin-binding protein 1C